MKKHLLHFWTLALLVMFGGSAWAADPDLANDYTLVKSVTWGDGTNIAGSGSCAYTAYDTGNKKQQSLTILTAPEAAAGWVAMQAWTDGSGKGWWNRAENGLYCVSAGRSAAVFGDDLTTGWLVIFECTQTASNVITVTNGAGEPDGTFSYVSSEDGKSYICTITAAENAYVGFCGNKNAGFISKISVYKPNKAVVATTYTVNYVDMDGGTLKDAVTYDAIGGAAITLSDADKANITVGDDTYVYDSDDTEGKTVAEDGTTAVNVKFHKAANFNYTVNEMCAGVAARVTNSFSFETANVTVPYRKYNAVEGQLYTKDATNKEYNFKFSLTKDNQVENLDYTAVEGVNNVVFLTEGEDIEGLTVCNSANTGIRSSNSSSAYATEDTRIVTLSAGTYKIHAIIYDASKTPDSHWIFNAGATNIADFNCTAVNIQEFDSEEFTLIEDTPIYLAQGGNNTMGLDALYITGTGSVVEVPAFDPATAIVNAEFNPEADPLGWEKVNSAQYYDLGMGLIGTYQVRGEHSAATVDETHLATEFAAGLECRWNTNYAAFTQTTAELPAGSYKLSFDVENTNATTTQANYENRFFVKVGETTYNDESTEWMNGKSAWTTHTITFTLTEASPITISLGYGTGSNNFGVGNTPALFVSHLMLDTCDPLVEAKAKAIAALETLAPIGEGLFFYNQTDIDNAKNAINAAETVEAVAAVAMPKATAPAADKAYAFQLRLDGETPLYMALAEGGITIAEEATALKFIAVEGTEGQYNLSNEDGTLFVGLAGGNAWTMSTLPDKMAAWTFTALPDGAYRINNLVTTGRFVGTNSAEKAAGSPCYADKQTSNGNVDWLIAEYVAPVKTDYTDFIVNADLKGEGGFDATGTKGIDGSGIVKVGNAAEFDFKQTISIPSGYYRLTAQAAYRYGGDEAAEAAAITEGTATKLLKMYVKIGDKEFSVPVQNRYDGASETNLASEGAVLVNDKYVPNSSSAVQAWFAAGQYVNEVIFNLPADGDVTIGINRIATPESDYTVIGPWTLTRLGDAEVEPEPEPIEGIIYSWESPEGTPVETGGTIAYVNGDGDRLNYAQGGYHTICLNGKKANIDDETASANAGKMVITLDKAVAEGDTIAYTAFINKNETKEASPYIVFENGTTAEGEVFGDEANIDATFNGVPTLKYTIVPAEAAGSKTITLTRSKTGTNLFITKLQIIEKKAEPEPEPTFFEFNGVAYIIDAETGKFVAAGHDYGTRGIISEIGLDLTFTANAETKMVTIDTKVKNSDTDHFLGSNLYMDAPAAEWGLLEQEFGFYITDGTKYLSIDANDNLALSEEPRLWILVTPEGVKNQILDDMKEASVEEPMDVTFLIKANNFNRNDQRNAEAWTVSADCTNKNLSGGNGVNNCVESFHSTFTISQAIEGAPKGVYALTAQGFYRQDGSDNDHLPVFFANEETKTFPVKSGSENSMSDASGSFTNGLYTIDPIFVQVAEAGTLTVGAKLEGNTALWCIWDNFQLTYYGADADIDAVKNAAIIKELADLRAKALGLKEQIDVEAVKNAIDEAIATTADVTGAEAINTAIATVKAVIEKAEFYLTAKTALASMENVMASTNVYTDEAFQTYNGIYAAAKAKYEAGELTAEDKLENPESLLGWHVANNVDDLLLSAWTIGETQCKDYDAGMYINTWSVEGENDGSNFKVPFFEYWTADANSLAENTLTATMTNLPEGKYDVTAWVRVRAKNGYTAPAYGITLSANEGEAVDVAAGDQVGTSQMYLKEFTAIGEVAADGVLKIQFKVAADNNISWLSFKNVKFVKQDVINDDDPEIEVAEGWRSIISNGNLASDEVANFFIKENAGDPVPAVIVPGAGKNNSRGIVINTPDNPSADWDAQFFIQANENIPAGYKIHVEFDYKASQEAAFDTQSHAEPGNYIHWYCVDSYTATTEWQHMSKEVEVSAATKDEAGNWNGEWGKACDASEGGKPFKTVAFNLSKVKFATTFYFDNIAFWVSKVSTGITDVKNEKKAETIYNLRGQKVNKADKGLFIINGKKVVK